MKREIISYRFPNELIANHNWKSILLNRYSSIFGQFYPKTFFLKQKTRIIFFFSYNYHLILLNNFTLNICSQFVSCFTKCKFFFLHELKKTLSFSFSSKNTYESVRVEVESKLYIEQHILKFVNHIKFVHAFDARLYWKLFISFQTINDLLKPYLFIPNPCRFLYQIIYA